MEQDLSRIQYEQSRDVIRHTLTRDVGVSQPFWQTLLFWVIPFAGTTFLFCLVAGLYVKLPWWIYFAAPIFVAMLTLFLVGRGRVFAHDYLIDRLVYTIESALAVDIDGDKQVGTPAPREINVSYAEEPGHLKKVRLTGELNDVLNWLTALYLGQSVSEDRWAGHMKPFSQDEVAHNRDELIYWELAQWKNQDHPKQGIEATGAGRVFIERILSQHRPGTPLPHPGGDG